MQPLRMWNVSLQLLALGRQSDDATVKGAWDLLFADTWDQARCVEEAMQKACSWVTDLGGVLTKDMCADPFTTIPSIASVMQNLPAS